MGNELNQIQCPNCKHNFSVTQAIAGDIQRDVERRYKIALQQKEAAMVSERETLAKQKEELQKNLQLTLAKEKALLETKLKAELAQSASLEMQDLKLQLAEKQKQAEEFAKNELELRQKQRALEEREKQQELELQRKLDAQRLSLEEDLKKRLSDEFQMKSAEKDLKLETMRKQIEELKRKSEQGSQQAQGEAFELELEKTLASRFPTDTITPVGKGIRGGDILHDVQTANGQVAGRILYELKNTKSWSDAWIQKAKDDQREAKAEVMVIVTSVLPKDVENFGMVDNIWVTDRNSFAALAMALRCHMLELCFARSAAVNKGEKLDTLYHYMTNTQFRQRVEAIVESFKSMRDGLESEKRAMQKIWASREKCLERVITNTAGMYGDIQGIIGGNLPRIESLELDSVPLLDNPDN